MRGENGNLVQSLRVFQARFQLEQGQEGGIQTEKKIQDPRGSGRGFCRHAAFLRLHGEYNKQWRKC